MGTVGVITSGAANPDFFHTEEVDGLHIEMCSIVGRRTNNQDTIGYTKDLNGTLAFVLCDGLGGHAWGELASSSVVEFLLNKISDTVLDTDSEILADELLDLFKGARKCLGFKDNRDTTVVVAIIFKDHIHLANIGDSWAVFEQNGKITKTEVQGHGYWVAHTVRSLSPEQVEFIDIPIPKNQSWTLCMVTDGCDEVTIEEITETILDARKICDIGSSRNSDNCSCILVTSHPTTVDSDREAIPDGAIT